MLAPGRYTRGLVPALLVLAACAPRPMTEERARSLCADEAARADGVEGTVAFGVGTGGSTGRVGVTITDDVFNPRDPEVAVQECIDEKMGRRPPRTRSSVSLGVRL